MSRPSWARSPTPSGDRGGLGPQGMSTTFGTWTRASLPSSWAVPRRWPQAIRHTSSTSLGCRRSVRYICQPIDTRAPSCVERPSVKGIRLLSTADELTKLYALRQSGGLSKEEFDREKARLLEPPLRATESRQPSPSSSRGLTRWRVLGVIAAVGLLASLIWIVIVVTMGRSNRAANHLVTAPLPDLRATTTFTSTTIKATAPVVTSIIGTWQGTAVGSTFCASGNTQLQFGASGTFTEACSSDALWGIYIITPAQQSITLHYYGSSIPALSPAGIVEIRYGFSGYSVQISEATTLHLSDSRGIYTLYRR